MGTYNTVHGAVCCPRCEADVTITAQCKLGDTTNLQDLSVGDEYPFRRDEVPPWQSFAADAYAECPECSFDFGLSVDIVSRMITGVRPESRTLVHSHDGTLRAALACPHCGAPGDKDIKLYNGAKMAIYRLGDSYPEAARRVGDSGWTRGRAYCEADCRNACFAVKVFLQDGLLRSVAVDPHQLDAAEDLYC